MVSRLLTSEQFQALTCHLDDVRQAAALVRSLAPDHWQTVFRAEKLSDRATERKGRQITTQEVTDVLAGFHKVCAVLGPGAQERLQEWIEPLVDRLGLADEVNRAAMIWRSALR